jgi:hypothetical protein
VLGHVGKDELAADVRNGGRKRRDDECDPEGEAHEPRRRHRPPLPGERPRAHRIGGECGEWRQELQGLEDAAADVSDRDDHGWRIRRRARRSGGTKPYAAATIPAASSSLRWYSARCIREITSR